MHRTLADITKESPIAGVEFKDLTSHGDDRGFFRELIRKNDPFFEEGFAQWSHSRMARDTVKAWHFHHRQVDWWYCPLGLMHTVLVDFREESPTYREKLEFLLGDPDAVQDADSAAASDVLTAVVRIPPGVLHGCRVLSDCAHLFYITSQTYDPQDEGRYPFDSSEVPHSWGDNSNFIVADNDRRLHIPSYERK